VTFNVDRVEDRNSVSSQPLQSAPSNVDQTAEAYNVEEYVPAFDGGDANILEPPPQEPSQGIAPLTDAVDAWPQMVDFDLSMPSFFESIMVPETSWVGAGGIQMPPDLDLTGVTSDYEEWSGAGDIFGFDFSTAFEQAMDTNIDETTAPNDAADPDGAAGNDPSANSARQRHHIFQRSPW
jgi:hypothetical protein